MEIERIDDPELMDRLGQSEGPRTRDHLHLSDIYKKLMMQAQPKRFDRRDKDGKPIPMDLRKVETGLLFENVLEQGLREKFATYRPGELVSPEGIYMSPDGVNLTESCGEEYKCTWMSSRPAKGHQTVYTDEYGMPNDKYLHWFIQMKGYAKHLDTDTFLLRVLHINGDYPANRQYTPTFMTHRVRFSQVEIEDNWRMLMRFARQEGMM